MVLHRFHVRNVLRFKQQNNIKYASVFYEELEKDMPGYTKDL